MRRRQVPLQEQMMMNLLCHGIPIKLNIATHNTKKKHRIKQQRDKQLLQRPKIKQSISSIKFRQFSGFDFDRIWIFCLIELIWEWQQFNHRVHEFSLIVQMALFTSMLCINVYSYESMMIFPQSFEVTNKDISLLVIFRGCMIDFVFWCSRF